MKEDSHVQSWPEKADSELYEDLLNRYERVLVYAGQLQEKVRNGRLLAAQNSSLQGENDRLKELLAAAETYVGVLENALESLGVCRAGGEGKATVLEAAPEVGESAGDLSNKDEGGEEPPQAATDNAGAG